MTRVLTARAEPDRPLAEVVELTVAGREPGPCGWCKDKFGVSWQVIPRELEELSGDYTSAANQRVRQAMLKMGRIDVAGLRAAYDDN